MLWKEDQSPRVKKERKPTLRGKWESVFSGRHTDNVPKETHAVSVMTPRPLATVAVTRDQKDDRFLPYPLRRQSRLTEKGDKEESSDKRSQTVCRKNVKTRRVSFGTFP